MISGMRLVFAVIVVLSVFCIVTSKHGHKKSHGSLGSVAKKVHDKKEHAAKDHGQPHDEKDHVAKDHHHHDDQKDHVAKDHHHHDDQKDHVAKDHHHHHDQKDHVAKDHGHPHHEKDHVAKDHGHPHHEKDHVAKDHRHSHHEKDHVATDHRHSHHEKDHVAKDHRHSHHEKDHVAKDHGHIIHHDKHKLRSKHHKHQPSLHLKAHKKGITFAKSPAEPQACIDFLPCLQYRYYHCRSHEWIRNNCPKLCLYCEHQPFPEPLYGRFKPVAASYPDWCLDHSQCVAYPTEACAYDEWMKLNCLRKCDICYKHKKVKAGIVFVGPPFDRTPEQKKEEHELNKILKFRPMPAKDKNSKAKAAKLKLSAAVTGKTASADGPAVVTSEKPIQAPNSANANAQDRPIAPEKPVPSSPNSASADLQARPIAPEKPVSPPQSYSPVIQQNIAAGKLDSNPEPKPAAVNAPESNQKPIANNPIGVPAYSYHDLMKQELKAAKEEPSTKQFKADVLKEVQIKLKSGHFPQINTAKVFVKHKVTKPKRKHVVESLSAPKHKVVKPKHKDEHKSSPAKQQEKHAKRLQKKNEKKLSKKEKLHTKKIEKDEKRREKEEKSENKTKEKVSKKRVSHVEKHAKKGKH